MTIGQDLDEQFIKIAQRLANLEDNQNEFAFNADIKAVRRDVGDLNHEVGMAATYESLKELEENISDLRCDLESQIEEVRGNVSYNDDRLDEVECYKVTEDEVECIVDRKMDDRFNEAFDYALEDIDLASLLLRVAELEARLNKPSLTARVLRWLREGPSIKEVATNWYAGIRRGS